MACVEGCIIEMGQDAAGPCGCQGCQCVRYKGKCDCSEKAGMTESMKQSEATTAGHTCVAGCLREVGKEDECGCGCKGCTCAKYKGSCPCGQR